MKEIKPPHSQEGLHPKVFLAGSIEMGKAVEWQTVATETLKPYVGTVLNPRREDWDASWEQTVKNPQFKEQVNWELDGLDKADFILVHFDPKTKSPITFGEFSAHYKRGNIFVSCPKGWWRRGNLEVMCDRAGIPLYESLTDALAAMIKRIEVMYETK